MFPFPPSPVFPEAIDSDETLFLVYNTTETRLATDNEAWSEEMDIVPVAADRPEIWADNGFGNIEGELFYYDTVEKNSDGKVNKLKRIGRNLGGERTSFNKSGTWVRSFVIAEHHNQLVNAIINVEDFVGENFSELEETLDWRIRHLAELGLVFDDYGCPTIDFTFNIIENDATTGILAEYLIEVQSTGQFSGFRLDFGDGSFTTTELSGQHRYALNTRIDPVVTVTNGNCQLLLTPAERENPTEPPAPVTPSVEIPIPEDIEFPDFEIVPCEIPPPQLEIPSIILPCTTAEGTTIPSVIIGPDLNLVSNVTITGLDFPIILVSHVTIEGPDFPIILVSEISIGPPIPSIIIIDPPIPSVIIIENETSLIGIDWGMAPQIGIDWGAQPKLDLEVTLTQPMQAVRKPIQLDPSLKSEFGEELGALLADEYTIEYEPIGIPDKIMLIAPSKEDLMIHHDLPEKIILEAARDLPKFIPLIAPEGFGKDIKILGPEKALPETIEILGISKITIEHDIPDSIKLDTIDLPRSLKLDVSDLPEYLEVRGMPSIIELRGMDLIPSVIEMIMPERQVEMIYRGSPIEMKLQIDTSALVTTDEQGNPRGQCFMMVPCNV